MNRILSIAGAGVAGLLLMGQAFAGVSEPVHLIDPANPEDSLIQVTPVVEPDPLLAALLPNYRKPAPDDCAEDMFCWIGSDADGRTNPEIIDALPEDIAASAAAYPELNEWTPAEDDCMTRLGDTTFTVCPDGYISAS